MRFLWLLSLFSLLAPALCGESTDASSFYVKVVASISGETKDTFTGRKQIIFEKAFQQALTKGDSGADDDGGPIVTIHDIREGVLSDQTVTCEVHVNYRDHSDDGAPEQTMVMLQSNLFVAEIATAVAAVTPDLKLQNNLRLSKPEKLKLPFTIPPAYQHLLVFGVCLAVIVPLLVAQKKRSNMQMRNLRARREKRQKYHEDDNENGQLLRVEIQGDEGLSIQALEEAEDDKRKGGGRGPTVERFESGAHSGQVVPGETKAANGKTYALVSRSIYKGPEGEQENGNQIRRRSSLT